MSNIHKTKNFENYVFYCLQSFTNPPEVFLRYSSEDVLPVGIIERSNGMRYRVYPNEFKDDIEIIYASPSSRIEVSFAKGPKENLANKK